MAMKRTAKRVARTKPKPLGSSSDLPSWEQRLKELKAFKKEHGHCNVPIRYQPNRALAYWVVSVRREKRNGTLAEERVRRLDALGFCWEPSTAIAAAWKKHLNDLKLFKKEHGHCNVPASYLPNRPLGRWATYIRLRKKAGKLARERIRCLEELGFCWALRKRSVFRLDWDVMLAALTAFAERHGHCNVPHTWPEDPRLSWYVKNLRSKRRKGKLDRRQIAQLNRLGIVWERALKPSWSEMYAALAEYKRVHGDCYVPYDWPDNPRLAAWISWQRHARRASRLEQGQIEQLDKLGFVWDHLEYRWESKYSALVKFRKEYGHCRVSTLSETHAALGNWVHIQRLRKKQGRLSAERIRRLDMLGFIWDMSSSRERPSPTPPRRRFRRG